jgi:phosphoglycolate phosphatase
MQLRVGFDLDMTLVDSHEGIVSAIARVLDGYGVTVSPEEIYSTVGVPLALVFPLWLPETETAAAIHQYREIYRVEGIPLTTLLPGARESMEMVRELGGETLVISAKLESAVRLVLDVVGLKADHVRGGLYAEEKGQALLELGAQIYVGDHPGDVIGAQTARAVSVAVTTGPTPEEELRAAGADVIVASLEQFPAWLEDWVKSQRPST